MGRNKRNLEHTKMCPSGNYCPHFNPETGVSTCRFAHHAHELRCSNWAYSGKCKKGDRCLKKHTLGPKLRKKSVYITTEGHRPDMVELTFVRDLPRYPLPYSLQRLVAQSKEEAVQRSGFGAGAAAESHLTDMYAFAPSLVNLAATEKFLRFQQVYSSLDTATVFLTKALQLELWQQLSDVRRYDISDAPIVEGPRYVSGKKLYPIYCDGLAEKRPSVLRGDRLYASDNSTNERHCGYVHFVDLDRVQVCFDQRRFVPSPTTTFAVEFTIQETPFRRQFDAFRHVQTLLTADEDLTLPVLGEDWTPESLEACRAELGFARNLNLHQCACVIEMVGHDPVPGQFGLSIIHGPPGTGKTTTVVAGLLELHDRGKRILVCCPSNHAADLIVERIAAVNPEASMARVYGLSTLPADSIKKYAPHPTLYAEAGKLSKIVVTTIMSAGLIHHLGVGSVPFDHIVVDEAAQATEAELAVPLLFAERSRGTHITLAGDHKQLGPVLRSRGAERFDLGKSTLERLMTTPSRKCHSIMLVDNYRSHPAILELYNKITYNNKLVSSAPTDRTSAATNLSKVFPDPHSPVVLRHVRGIEERERDSPSWMNKKEVDEVISVLRNTFSDPRCKFTFADVVVITPYQKQCKKISGILHWMFDNRIAPFVVPGVYNKRSPPINVCSVEQFQGREAKLVILSCVRSTKREELDGDLIQSIGFLKQPKRFNVAISRAIAGLVVVGNAGMLQVDEAWRKLIYMMAGCTLDGEVDPLRQSKVVDVVSNRILSPTEVKDLKPTAVAPGSGAAAAAQSAFVSRHIDPSSISQTHATDTEWPTME